MDSQSLRKQVVGRILPQVQTPAQYVGGELNSVVKDHAKVRGKLCLAFPDLYTIGMSHYGLQVLYRVMNRRDDWACERVFAPGTDMEGLLRRHRIPLYSLETFTPLGQFDVLGFTLQYELCSTNVLTILDLAGIPLSAERRTLDHPLVIAGGPCVQNPEPMGRFIDLFVLGDGEESLPQVCDKWLEVRSSATDQADALSMLASELPHIYVPRFYRYSVSREMATTPRPVSNHLPEVITPAVVADLDAMEPPTAPVVPYVGSVQDRIAVEIMRGCPWRCRFCQGTVLKHPVRFRRVETIVRAAMEAYRNTGYNEISLLSLSTGDYPDLEDLVKRLHDLFRPLGVNIAVPSLRVDKRWRTLAEVLTTYRHSGLTLAPEVARDDMRRQIGKRIKNDDLYEGCRKAFERGFQRVKLYFMCGLPGEREADLDGVIEMSEAISRLGKEVSGRPVKVVANVSNFVPKPHTPFQWNGMQTREYFQQVHQYLRRRRRRSVDVKCHDVESSLLEGVLSRGDRRVGAAIELAWRRGARFDAWNERLQPELWWQALADAYVDVATTLHRPRSVEVPLPWEHIALGRGRCYLEEERKKALKWLRTTECDQAAVDSQSLDEYTM